MNFMIPFVESLNRVFAIIKKEFLQLYRDKRSLIVFIFIPSFTLILFGYALNLDVKNTPIVIWDKSQSYHSREFVREISNNEHFTLVKFCNSYKEIELFVQNDVAKVGVIIPDDFENSIYSDNNPEIQIIVNGAQSMIAMNIINYLNLYVHDYSIKMIKDLKVNIQTHPAIVLEPRVWYNPELKTANFFVPGLIGFILMILSVIATTLTFVREKERNTIEQIIVSPVRNYEIIIGKLVAPLLIALISASLILLTGRILFGVTIKGNILILFIATFIFLLTSLSLGIFISVLASSQQVALLVSILSTIIPTLAFSGFVFPINSMPLVLQYFSFVIPAKYYLIVLRGVILKGVGFMQLWEQFVYLTVFLLAMSFISLIVLKLRGLR